MRDIGDHREPLINKNAQVRAARVRMSRALWHGVFNFKEEEEWDYLPFLTQYYVVRSDLEAIEWQSIILFVYHLVLHTPHNR